MSIAIVEINSNLRVSLIREDDRVVLHYEKNDAGHERDSLAAWADMIEPGRVAIDVGAYTGIFAIIAAKLRAEAVAIEPMPANQWRISCNMNMNKTVVRVIVGAASDHSGNEILRYNPRVPLTTGASLETGIEHHRASMVVKVFEIDALALSNVCAIKIDTERHDAVVLRGAMRTIERDRPKLLIETLDDAARDRITEMLPGYRVAAVLDGRNTVFEP